MLSKVDRDSVMKMILVIEKVAVPKNLETAVGLPASMLAKIACGTLQGSTVLSATGPETSDC